MVLSLKIFFMLLYIVLSNSLLTYQDVAECSSTDCSHIYMGKMLNFEHKISKVEDDAKESQTGIALLQRNNEKINQTFENIYSEIMHLTQLTREFNRTIVDQQEEMRLLKTETFSLKEQGNALNRTVKDQQALLESCKENVTLLEQTVSTQSNGLLNWTHDISLAHEDVLMPLNWTNRAQAFVVRLNPSSDPIAVHGNAKMVFEDVIMNVNDAYNTSTGQVRVGTAGRYFFSLTVRAYAQEGTGGAHAIIKKNNQIIAEAIAFDTSSWDGTGSVSVILDLSVGDTVYLLHGPSNEVWQGSLSVFTGCLLYPL